MQKSGLCFTSTDSDSTGGAVTLRGWGACVVATVVFTGGGGRGESERARRSVDAAALCRRGSCARLGSRAKRGSAALLGSMVGSLAEPNTKRIKER